MPAEIVVQPPYRHGLRDIPTTDNGEEREVSRSNGDIAHHEQDPVADRRHGRADHDEGVAMSETV